MTSSAVWVGLLDTAPRFSSSNLQPAQHQGPARRRPGEPILHRPFPVRSASACEPDHARAIGRVQ